MLKIITLSTRHIRMEYKNVRNLKERGLFTFMFTPIIVNFKLWPMRVVDDTQQMYQRIMSLPFQTQWGIRSKRRNLVDRPCFESILLYAYVYSSCLCKSTTWKRGTIKKLHSNKRQCLNSRTSSYSVWTW